MISILLLIIFLSGICVLGILSIIDLKTYLLPNPWVATFAALGFAFHFINGFEALPLEQVAYGALAGFWTLYIIRALGNWYYKQDSLGLGDVKLLGAGGIWLGVNGVFMAITAGAFAGLIHGIIYAVYIAIKNKKSINMHRLRIPAGPGFAAGIIGVSIWQYYDLLQETVQNLF
ncbi:MAG: prepilin peptidase [Alphaproteobacteria bacterium]|nr:prepilin peptidase [Alphaproteobacteria bacterium]